MAKRSKKSYSLAARKGWVTRRKNALHAKRSAAAKKGWITRRKKEREEKEFEQPDVGTEEDEEITRQTYKAHGSTGGPTQIEIRTKSGKITSVRVDNREYTRPKDFAALRPLLEASS